MQYTTKDRIKKWIETTTNETTKRALRLMLQFGASQIEYNPKTESGFRWIENVNKGLRLVGFADEINTYIQHTGWFTHPEGFGETMRGIVYQLPARNGKEQYIAGYSDPYNPDCAFMDFSEIHDDKTDAARASDSIAESFAEKEREYREAYDLGRQYSDAMQTITTAKETRRALAKELRLAKLSADTTPTICGILRNKIQAARRNIQTANDERREIVDDHTIRGDHLEAFADAASMDIEDVKKLF